MMNTYSVEYDIGGVSGVFSGIPYNYTVAVCIRGIQDCILCNAHIINITRQNSSVSDSLYTLATHIVHVNDAVRISTHALLNIFHCVSCVCTLVRADYDLALCNLQVDEIEAALSSVRGSTWPNNEEHEKEVGDLFNIGTCRNDVLYGRLKSSIDMPFQDVLATAEKVARTLRAARAQCVLNPTAYMKNTILINNEPVFLTLQQLRGVI